MAVGERVRRACSRSATTRRARSARARRHGCARPACALVRGASSRARHPEWRARPMMTCSSTVMSPNSLMVWKVRTMPRRAASCIEAIWAASPVDADGSAGRPGRSPVTMLIERGLAGAVRSDQRVDRARLDAQAHVAQRLQAAEALRDILELERAPRPSPRTRAARIARHCGRRRAGAAAAGVARTGPSRRSAGNRA